MGAITQWHENFLEGLKNQSVDVPCNGCSVCCRCGFAILLKEDEVDRFKGDTMSVELDDGRKFTALKVKKDGSCIYVNEQGCSIHETRPRACRVFDCRGFAFSRTTLDGKDELNEVTHAWRDRMPCEDEEDIALQVSMSTLAGVYMLNGNIPMTAVAKAVNHGHRIAGNIANILKERQRGE